ncbi:hypothetical protein ACFIOZ_03415 [Vreelandella sp. F11]|uniref:hypothetical protein n=1 Tax=Vreelandella sp. F11 TaxID=3394751 RepID=UPI0036DF6752
MKKLSKKVKKVNRVGKTGRVNKASLASDAFILPDYYQLVFSEIHDEHHEAIHQKYVVEPLEVRRSFLLNIRDFFNDQDEDKQYELLMNVLSKLECELKSVIEKHTVFYWIHLYRRLAPCLSSDLGGNTNDTTVYNVRNHVEQSIFKYGDLSGNKDFALSSEIEFDNILGGMLGRSLRKNFPEKILNMYILSLKKHNPQWVLTDFSEENIIDIYNIEGLGYQYWYVSAKMRALGKGIALNITETYDVFEDRTSEQESLIRSFDNRNEESSLKVGWASNVGTFIPSKVENVNETIFCAALNPSRCKLKDLGIESVDKDFSPNYIPCYVNASEYYSAHKYLEDFFEDKFKFGLLEFCQFAIVFSHIAIGGNVGPSLKSLDIDSKKLVNFYMKYQRAYSLYEPKIIDIKEGIINHFETLRKQNAIGPSRLEEQLDKILKFITLDENNQSSLGVWSNGPKPVLVEADGLYICDYSSWLPLLKNVFFGLRNYDPQSKKGVEFECAFSAAVTAAGFEVVLKSTEIKFDKTKREVDVAVRIKDNLYLFECRASERPLDFVIGKPKTIRTRCDNFEEKLNQVSTLGDFIKTNRKGGNYNFEWAREIHSFVVSPYTEWVWSTASCYWTECKKYPRIMSVYEAIEYLKAECEKNV